MFSSPKTPFVLGPVHPCLLTPAITGHFTASIVVFFPDCLMVRSCRDSLPRLVSLAFTGKMHPVFLPGFPRPDSSLPFSADYCSVI